MNKKKLAIPVGIIIVLSTFYFYLGTVDKESPTHTMVPMHLLPEIEYSKVSNARNAVEMVGEKLMMEKREPAAVGSEIYNGIESLEEEYWYRRDIYLQLSIIYTLSEKGTIGTPPGVIKFSAEKSEFVKLKNEVELLRREFTKMEVEGRKNKTISMDTFCQKDFYEKLSAIKEEYTSKRDVFHYTVLIYNLRNNKSLKITPSWEEGEHYLAPEGDHVWVGIYSTPEPGATNFLGCYTTDTFTPDMTHYWDETLKRNPETKSIRIKWIYTAEGRRIVWEGNKNENESWYTFAEYPGDPQDDIYTVVNMSLLSYPEYQQYYVVGE